MSDFLYCLLSYAASVLILLIVPAILWKLTPEKRSKEYAVYGLLLAWSGLIINIIYTGLLGWNRMPSSTLEWGLDIASGLVMFIGLVTFQFNNARTRESVKAYPKM